MHVFSIDLPSSPNSDSPRETSSSASEAVPVGHRTDESAVPRLVRDAAGRMTRRPRCT